MNTYTLGTGLTVGGPWHTYTGGRALCSDGKVRALKRIAPTGDTWFSVPASVSVWDHDTKTSKTVLGFVTVETLDGYTTPTDDDPAVVKFQAVTYGKNHTYLPSGAYVRERIPDPNLAQYSCATTCKAS